MKKLLFIFLIVALAALGYFNFDEIKNVVNPKSNESQIVEEPTDTSITQIDAATHTTSSVYEIDHSKILE